MDRQDLIVDIDGTLAEQTTGKEAYWTAKPILEMINKTNNLYDQGYKIKLFTSRGMKTFQGNLSLIEENYRYKTEKWLKDHKVKYHELIFGKPSGIYIDNDSLNNKAFLEKEF